MKLYILLCIAAVNVFASIPKFDELKLKAVGRGYIFEGDMVMKREKIEAALNGNIDVEKTFGYAVTNKASRRWPHGIVPYVLDSSVINKFLKIFGGKGPTEKAILKAMKAWESKTCLKFIKRTNQPDYVKFKDDGFGQCYSYIGRIGGEQIISLGFGCFSTGIAIHEIGHALGLYHEQSRPDRDQYVEIIWKNIKSSKKDNFRKYDRSSIDSLGSPYDYDSIMHYEKRAFAKFPFFQRTIRSKTSRKEFGQRKHISVQDAIQINKRYSCNI